MSTPRSLELPDRVQRRTIRTHRGAFAVLDAQPARGVCERRPALLVPGYTGSKEDFLTVLQPLAAAGRRVVAVDLRGQYQSDPAADPDGYLADALAADVAAVAADVADGEPGVHLLGHSFGGLIARQALLAQPGAFWSLTLLGSGPAGIGGRRAELLRAVLALLAPAGPGVAPDAEELRQKVRRLWQDHLGPQAHADGVPAEIIAFLRKRTLRTCPVGLVAMGSYLLDCPDRTAELAAVPDARILVLYGENDDAWPPAVQDAMARRLRAQRVCIPGAAHAPPIEAPETTAGTLTAFWNAAEWAERRHRPAPRTQAGRPASAAAGEPAGSSSGTASPSQGRRGSLAVRPSGQRAR